MEFSWNENRQNQENSPPFPLNWRSDFFFCLLKEEKSRSILWMVKCLFWMEFFFLCWTLLRRYRLERMRVQINPWCTGSKWTLKLMVAIWMTVDISLGDNLPWFQASNAACGAQMFDFKQKNGAKWNNMAEYYLENVSLLSLPFAMYSHGNGTEQNHFVPHQTSLSKQSAWRCKAHTQMNRINAWLPTFGKLKATKWNWIWSDIPNSIGRILSCHS